MTDFIAIFLAVLFTGLIGYGVFVAAKDHFRKKRARENPLFRHAESEIKGEKRHCDGYSAGTFYW